MSDKERTNMKGSAAQDAVESNEGKNRREQLNEEAGSSKDDEKDTKTQIDFEMNKPWPPLLAEFTGKPRSYSDTSPRREIIKALTKGDIRSCTSYMHLPHIKHLTTLHDSTSSPHLHQSFSRMHLPTHDQDNDVPTISVIALAEARDKDGTDDVIYDDDDVKDLFVPLDDGEDSEEVREEAIYTWDREYGRTRSLSEPPDLNSLSGKKEVDGQRPRAMSLESAEKAKKPPARMQFQLTLEELAENQKETESESPTEQSELEPDQLDQDHLDKSSILVLAESGDFENDSSLTDSHVKDSDSQDEVLTRWTRYEGHPVKKPSFCADLSTIDENLGEGGGPPKEIIGGRSVLQLVDEVTKNVMSNENLVKGVQADIHFRAEVEAEIEDETFWTNKKSPRLGMRRVTLATASPAREAQNYATDIEREAFNKISQWKTDFAVKLEDVLSKGIEQKTEDKQQKPLVVNVPMNLSDIELRGLKGDLLSELRRKSNADARGTTAASKRTSPVVYHSRSPDAKKEVAQDANALSSNAHFENPPVQLDNIAITKDKIIELLQWHDRERERLLLEMKKMQVSREYLETPSASAQVVLESTGLESVFCSLQIIMDSIFKETILRLRGQLDSDSLEGKKSDERDVGRSEQQSRVGRFSPTKEKEKERQKKAKMAGKRTQGFAASQQAELEKQSTFAKKKTHESRILESMNDKNTGENTGTKTNQVKISSGTQDKPRSHQATHKKETGAKSSSLVHVHTASFAEHMCHQDTCAGMAEESSANSCECDSASDEMETTESEDEDDETTGISGTDLGEHYDSSEFLFDNLAGYRPEVLPGKSSTNDTDVIPTSSTSIPRVNSSSSPLTSRDSSVSDKAEKDSLSSEELDEEERGDELDFEESDACSEIADLLGVYQVYNASNEHDNEVLSRPHAPELMTYEEKDMKDKMNRQRIRLNGYKRIVHGFKTKNKRLKEEQLHLRRQIHELHDRCAKKEARITELKHEIEPAMKGYRKALEVGTNIIGMKEKQMLKMVEPEADYEQTVQEARWETYDGESKKYLKTIIRDKEKAIQELVSQHEKTFQDLTNKIYKVMSERDELKDENSRLKSISRAEEFERKKKKLEAQVVRLEKALKEALIKHEEKDRVNQSIISSLQKKLHETKTKHDEDSRLLYETQRSFEELKTSSSSTMEEQENEILTLKASVDAFQNLLMRVTEETSEASQRQNRPTPADHDFMKAALKEAVDAREDETRRHLQTQAKLDEANERMKKIDSIFKGTTPENMIENMKKQLESLQNENYKLKSHLQRKQESGSILIQVSELQTKLAQRDRELKQLKEEGIRQREEKNRLLTQLAELSRDRPAAGQGKIVEFTHEDSSGGNLSLAERCTRQWKEDTELEQQELDELRGKTSAFQSPTDYKNIIRLRKDVNDIKSAFEGFIRTQSRDRNIEQDEFKQKLELKAKRDMEKQESFYKQIIETKEKAYAEVLKEKDIMIQILNESKNLDQSKMVSEAVGTIIKDVIERGVSRKMEDLRKSIEMISRPPQSEIIHEVISDLLKMNQKATNRLEDCTERAWVNVKEDIDELKDFTFKMTDAIEKHFYSTHEHLLNSSIEEVIKHVKNESKGVRKSFLDGMQAHYERLVEEIKKQGTSGLARYDRLQSTIDGQNRSNMREFHQARRDVLLAAEAVSNSAEELYQIKKTLTQEFLPTEAGQMVKKEDEATQAAKKLNNPFEGGKTLEQLAEDYPSKASTSSTEEQHKGLSVTGKTTYSLNTTAELANLEGAILSDSFSSMNGEDPRHTYQHTPLFHTPPSRDSDGLSLRERLQQRKKARSARTSTEGVSPSEPYTTKIAPFWSRDKPSSAK
ncbi:uncharacterized protein LOC116299977 [Actinia tenebrosa]|uniref:Uncharacterized protein LOC116299977 n=1 Tax=Actinia tenebrosa TaxID=6105 RepID=A0A6P8IEQ7_ACTTE|nr:uncharacterized protein LOC116299977 [Actinia tenebrosa]